MSFFNKLTQGQKVFLGTSFGLAFSYFTFFGLRKPKKRGHNLFDVEKPEEVTKVMDKKLADKILDKEFEDALMKAVTSVEEEKKN